MAYKDPEKKREYDRQHRLRNLEEYKTYQHEWYKANKEKKDLQGKLWRQANRGKALAYTKKWQAANPEKLQVSREKSREANPHYSRDRARTDINFRLVSNLRSRLYYAFKDDAKSGSAVRDLGCSIGEFKLYIANQFEGGMTWENYGEVWELDHVMPLNQFDLTDRVELL